MNMIFRLTVIQKCIRSCSVCFQNFAKLLCEMTCDPTAVPQLATTRTGGTRNIFSLGLQTFVLFILYIDVLDPLPGRPTRYIETATAKVPRLWLREHIKECLIYGVFNSEVGQTLMDDACVKDECIPLLWLQNVIDYTESKDMSFHVKFEEVADTNVSTSIPNASTVCPPLELKVFWTYIFNEV